MYLSHWFTNESLLRGGYIMALSVFKKDKWIKHNSKGTLVTFMPTFLQVMAIFKDHKVATMDLKVAVMEVIHGQGLGLGK